MKIKQCTITLTRGCNLRCSFCYAKGTKYLANKTVDYDRLKKIIDFCDECKVTYIVFTGGEPLMYEHFMDILKYIKSKKHKMLPTIASNGILLANKKLCDELVANGLSYIDISLKGANEEEWTKITGKNYLENQKKAISNLSKMNIEYTCSMVLCKSNIDNFLNNIRMAYDNGARQFSFTFAIDNSYSNKKNLEYLKENNPRKLICKFISQIEELNSITKEWWIEYSYPICMYTEKQLLLLKNKLALPCQIHTKSGITFDTDLNLIPCNMGLDIKLGQFGKDFSNFKEFRKFAKKGKYREVNDELSQIPDRECKRCKYYKACNGGCPILWRNYSYNSMKKILMDEGI